MTARRRAGAPRLIDWTGERCVPWAEDVQMVYEHLHRYLWAAELVTGRAVLDLGSGEGFGAAILAERARSVLGIDRDERTVEHSGLNYADERISFSLGDAADLSDLADDSFDAVVAFEVIEHLDAHAQVMAEIARVLRDDGLLIMSTPDRRAYSEATGQDNPFHVRELSLDEFHALLATQFAHTELWTQRAITGSHISALHERLSGEPAGEELDFYIERAGDDWQRVPGASPFYLIAVASRVPLAAVRSVSTLADAGLTLVRAAESRAAAETRVAETGEAVAGVPAASSEPAAEEPAAEESAARPAPSLREKGLEVYVRELSEDLADARDEVREREAQTLALSSRLHAAEAAQQQLERSVSVQIIRKVSGAFYRVVGRQSRFARGLQASLRAVGRLVDRSAPQPPALPGETAVEPPRIELPVFDEPEASLVIPCHARADLTRGALETIKANSLPVAYEVILIDDDADAETKRLLSRVTGATVITNRTNLGYLRSMNRAAAVARGRWLVLCNNDIGVSPRWLEALIRCGESAPDIGIVTPRYIFPDESLNEAGGIIWRDGTGWNYGRGDGPDHPRYTYRREVDYGSAAALLVRADFWRRRGGFDERFAPMYYEDVDLCFDAREHGLRVMYEPESVVVHHEGATAGTDVTSGPKRHQEENRAKFVDKWRHRLESEHLAFDLDRVRAAARRHTGPNVLVVDFRVPMPDRDAGSLRMLHLLQALRARGCGVTFLPDNFSAVQPYTRALQREGIEVLYDPIDTSVELGELGADLRLAILSRPHQASRWLDVLRDRAPRARLVYDTVDLHWLREARRVNPGGGSTIELSPKAAALRELELAMVRASDVTLVVTDRERQQVEADVPGADVRVVPTIHEVWSDVPPPGVRSGVLFVGGFEHTPNISAAIALVRDIMPLVWRERPDVPVSIIGGSAPPEVEALASSLVDVAGWVADLDPLLRETRVMAAPISFGAGLKGKITQSLSTGLPVVTTTVGAEGLNVTDGEELLIADDPAGAAAGIVRLLDDSELWMKLSRNGRAVIAEHCSPAVMAARMAELLDDPLPANRPSSTVELLPQPAR